MHSLLNNKLIIQYAKESIFIIFLILFLVIQKGESNAQTMEWVFIPTDSTSVIGCTVDTDCDANTYCFGLRYTPTVSGVATSYTTGFFATCNSNGNPIISNTTCVMTDNSNLVDDCSGSSMVLFNSSGNSGSAPANDVVVGVPVFLHQICLEIPVNETIDISEDHFTDLSVSVSLDGGGFITEFPSFIAFSADPTQLCTDCPNPNQKVIYVDAGATGSGTGLSWADAFLSVTDALNSTCFLKFDTILIAEGKYITAAATREESFVFPDSVVVIGGYSIGGASRNPAIFQTILSGDRGNPNSNSDNIYHVVYVPPTSSGVQLHGLSIKDGFADGALVHNQGGGVLSEGKIVLDDVFIEDNNSLGFGSAMSIIGISADVELRNSTIGNANISAAGLVLNTEIGARLLMTNTLIEMN